MTAVRGESMLYVISETRDVATASQALAFNLGCTRLHFLSDVQVLYYPSPLDLRPIPNIQVGPSSFGLTGNFFTYCTDDGLFRDVNTPGNWIQLQVEGGDAEEWGLAGFNTGQFLVADVNDLTGQISVRGTKQTQFYVCNDEPDGLGVKLCFKDFVLTTGPLYV